MNARAFRRPLLSRRVFVRAAGGAAAYAAGMPWLACTTQRQASERATDASSLQPEAPAGLCLPFLTPTSEFYRQYGGKLVVDDWQMPDLGRDHAIGITGLVSSATEVTLDDLERDAEHHETVVNTLMCVWGFRSCAMWVGVPVSRVLDQAGIDRKRARRVRFRGADGFENNLHVADVYEAPADMFEPLLAFRINGEALPRELGFPVRLLTNDRFGFKNIKWLERIEITESDEDVGQYNVNFRDRVWTLPGSPDPADNTDAVKQTVPTVETQGGNDVVTPGPIEICGFALSGWAGIESVGVSVNGEAYQDAKLATLAELRAAYPELNASVQLDEPDRFEFPWRGVWVPWRIEVALDPGFHRIDIHARDRAGNGGNHAGLLLTVKSGA
jgi:DMSO/TMAO reductase YedYZ molybdopterin-dependent catalytic subunit